MTGVSFFRSFGAIALALVTGMTTPPALAAAPAVDGGAIFRQRCQICHSVVAAAPSGVGPNLNGVAGRKAAATTFNYSPALKQSKLMWTQANLDRFIAGPTRLVPGTRMVVSLSDPAQRAEVIKFLMRPR